MNEVSIKDMLPKIDCIIGIDPGANGGIAVWRPNSISTAVKMPQDITSLRDYLLSIKDMSVNPIAFLEKVSIRPDDVMIANGTANMGKVYRIQSMMRGYEEIKAMLTLLDIPFVMVHPMKWQSALKLRGEKGETKAERKNRYKSIAAKMYPEIKPTLWSADATLIMQYGRWAIVNDPNWVRENLPTTLKDRLF